MKEEAEETKRSAKQKERENSDYGGEMKRKGVNMAKIVEKIKNLKKVWRMRSIMVRMIRKFKSIIHQIITVGQLSRTPKQ